MLSFDVDLQYIALVTRSLLAWIFVASGTVKLFNISGFIEAVRDYKLLPDNYAILTGKTLPYIELAIAINLFAGVASPWDLSSAIVLLLLFTTAVAINLLRDHKDISCGCWRVGPKGKLSWLIVMRNLSLMLISVPALYFSFSRKDVYLDPASERLTVIGTVGCIFAIGLLTDTIKKTWRLGSFYSSRQTYILPYYRRGVLKKLH